MDRDLFYKILIRDDIPSTLSDIEITKIHKIIDDSINFHSEKHKELPHGFINLMVASSELTELKVPIEKYLNTFGDKYDRVGILEEIADAYLSLLYIQKILDIKNEEINKSILIKVERERLRCNVDKENELKLFDNFN